MSRTPVRPLVKLLLFAAVTVVLTGILAQTLGSFWLTGGTVYRARFTDVTGVLVGDDVRIAGVKVGQVSGVRLVDDGVAELSLRVQSDLPLDSGVRAKVRYRNIVGQRYIALSEGPATGHRLRPDELIPLSQTTPALDLTVLFNGFRPLFTALSPQDVNKLAYELIQVLQGEGGTMSSLLQHTASLTNTLADRDAVIGRVITNLNTVLGTLDSRDQQLGETIKQLQLLVSGLAADRTSIGNALVSIGDLTDATAGLLRDSRPALKQDVDLIGKLSATLNDNSAQIDQTLSTLPGRYTGLARVASYGSWLNFYLCDFDGQVNVPGAGEVNPTTFTSYAARCQGGG